MMGGLTSPPPPPETPPDPASDQLSPLGRASTGSIEAGMGDELKLATDTILKFLTDVANAASPGVRLVAFIVKNLALIITKGEVELLKEIDPLIASLVQSVTQILGPPVQELGKLSGVFVQQLTTELQENVGPDAGDLRGGPAGSAAYAFDSILSPIAKITGGVPPDAERAGASNIQHTLTSIVQVHLTTWVVNLLSNLTGAGALKFFNSFSEVILGGLNTRSLSRLAMRPYIDTYMAEPAKKELNTLWPLKLPSAAALIKQFNAGKISVDDFHKGMKEFGYSEEVAANFLLETVRELSPAQVAYLVKHRYWTEEQGVTYLVDRGFDESIANVVLFEALHTLVFELQRLQADALGTHYAKRELDGGLYREILSRLGFSDEEVDAYVARYGVELEFPRRVSAGQVKALYEAGLVDLGYVREFFLAEGYDADTTDLLVLLDFATTETRSAQRAVLGAQARLLAAEKSAEVVAKTAKGEAEIAAALAALAKAKARLAASLGQ